MIYVVKYHNGGWAGPIDLFTAHSKKGVKKFRKKCSRFLEREYGREVKDAMIPKIYVESKLEVGDPGYVQVNAEIRPTVGARLREAAQELRAMGVQAPVQEDGTWAGIVRTQVPEWRATPPTTGGRPLFGNGGTIATTGTLRGTDWVTRFYE